MDRKRQRSLGGRIENGKNWIKGTKMEVEVVVVQGRHGDERDGGGRRCGGTSDSAKA